MDGWMDEKGELTWKRHRPERQNFFSPLQL